MSGWFRMHDEALDDPKVQRLPVEDFKFWVNSLMLANRHGGVLPSIDDIVFAFRMDEIAVVSTLDRLVIAGLFDVLKGGAIGRRIAPHGWEKRQYKSDTSTERVKRFREKTETVSETPLRARSESDQIRAEQKEEKSSYDDKKKGCRLPDGWAPSDAVADFAEGLGCGQSTLDEFHDYWKGQPGQKGVKLDWGATFRNWCRNEAKRRPHGRQQSLGLSRVTGDSRKTATDANGITRWR